MCYSATSATRAQSLWVSHHTHSCRRASASRRQPQHASWTRRSGFSLRTRPSASWAARSGWVRARRSFSFGCAELRRVYRPDRAPGLGRPGQSGWCRSLRACVRAVLRGLFVVVLVLIDVPFLFSGATAGRKGSQVSLVSVPGGTRYCSTGRLKLPTFDEDRARHSAQGGTCTVTGSGLGMDRQKPSSRRLALLTCGALVALALAAGPATADPPANGSPDRAFVTGGTAVAVSDDGGDGGSVFVQVKFAAAAKVSLADGDLSTDGDGDARLQRQLEQADVSGATRLFSQSPADLRDDLAALRQRASPAGAAPPVPALDRWYRIRARSPDEAADLAANLSTLADVEVASVIPQPPPLPVTPNFTTEQGYRNTAPGGIGATAVAGVAGASGDRVKIIDIEYAWDLQHEDVAVATPTFVRNGTPCQPFADSHHHGTAVLGELIGGRNSYGVTGIVPDADIATVNAADTDFNGSCYWDLADAINIARGVMARGDVMLIEQQTSGPNSSGAYVPTEWDPAVYDSIVAATSAGIIVVEAAGNGSQNLNDSSLFGSPFPLGRPNSGAIIVGAGAAPGCTGSARQRLSFSTYGSRVNLQGWGECVTSAGYGDRWGSSILDFYTGGFSGTSSASPIVAGAAAAMSSALEARTGQPPTPAQVRQTLVATGTPQYNLTSGPVQNIGPLPNLAAALGTVTATPPQAPTLATATVTSATSARLTWAPPLNDGGSPVAGYLVARDGGGTGKPSWSKVVPATTGAQGFSKLTTGATYRLSVAAINAEGTGPEAAVSVLVRTATAPSAPVIGTAQAGAAGGAITARAAWSPPASDGGATVTGYRVRALRMSEAGAVLSTTTSTVQSASARNLSMTLPRKAKYRFTVQAINSVGAGPQSARSKLVAGR